MNICKYNINECGFFLLVLFTITTSGASWSIMLLALTSLFMIAYGRKVDKKNILISIIMLILLFVNSFFFGIASFDSHEFVVYILRFFSIAVVASVMTYREFMDKYVKIIVAVLVLGEIVWICKFIGDILNIQLLPNVLTEYIIHDNVSIFPRLRGIFWEAGVCQIHANMVISYLILSDKIKHMRLAACVCILGVIFTISTTGYLILCLQFVLYCVHNYDLPRKIGVNVMKILLALIVLFLLEEMTVGVIWSKLIAGESSAASRYDDTLLSLLISKDYLLNGIGVATDWHSVFLDYINKNTYYLIHRRYYWPDLASSNGLGNCMYKAGIPFTIWYMVSIYRQYKNKLGFSITESFLMMCVFLFVFIGEPIMGTPFMLLNFFEFSKKEDVVHAC